MTGREFMSVSSLMFTGAQNPISSFLKVRDLFILIIVEKYQFMINIVMIDAVSWNHIFAYNFASLTGIDFDFGVLPTFLGISLFQWVNP